MYSEYFGLRTLPFEDRADTQFYFAAPELEETLASLLYELHHGSGLGFLTGESGSGKTLLVRTLLTRLDKTDQVTVLTWAAQNRMDLIREACKGFGVTLPSSHNQARRLNRLRRHLTRAAESRQRSILIVDQAENLSADNLAQISALVDLEGASGRLLKIVLVAQPQIQSTLEGTQFARIRQQLFGERRLTLLNPQTTRDYIEHRLRIAGASDRSMFDPDAYDRVFEISQGVPRLINRVCNASLLAAYGAGMRQVTGALVIEAAGQQSLRERSSSFADLGLANRSSRTAPWIRPSTIPVHASESDAPIVDAETDTIEESFAAVADEVAESLESAGEYTMQDVMTSSSMDSMEESAPNSQRLERAILKAERLAVTTEASLSQLKAVEKHLSSLLDRAEAISKNLAPMVQKSSTSIEQAQRRLTESVQRAEQRVAGFQSQSSRMTEWTERIEELLTKVERTTTAAATLESRMNDAAAVLAEKAGVVESQVAHLSTGLADAGRIEQRLSESAKLELSKFQSALAEEFARNKTTLRTAADEINRQAESGEKSARQSAAQCAQSIEQAVKDAMEKAQTQLDAILKHAASARSETHDQFTDTNRALQNTLEEAKRFQSELLGSTLENSRRDWREMVERGTRDADSMRAEIQQSIERSASQVKTIQADLQRLGTESAAVRTAVKTIESAVSSSVQSVDRLEAKLSRDQETLRDLEDRATALESLPSLLESAKDVLSRVHGAESQIATLNEQTRRAVADADRGADRAAAACKHIAEVEQVLARTRLDRAAAQEATFALRTATDEAIQAHQAISRAAGDAESLQSGLYQTTSEARSASNELRATLRSSQEVLDLSSQTIQAAREEARLAREQSESLNAAKSRAIAVQETLDATLRTAHAREESLHGLVLHAEEKTHRLGSHHAAASSILERMASGTSTGHQLVERLSKVGAEANDRVTEAESKVERMIGDVWSLAARTESLSKELFEQHDAAKTEKTSLVEAVALGSETGKLLSAASSSAQELLNGISEQNDRGQRMLGKLTGLATALDTAAQTQASLQEALSQAKRTEENLRSLSTDIDPRTEALQTVSDEARTLIESFQHAQGDARATAAKLASIVSAHAERLAQADVIADEASARIERMRDELSVVSQKLNEFTTDLAAAAGQPKAMLDAVQAQTKQLEQVCAAVRKVFASLSQATLDARRQTDELKSAGSEVGQRWSQLAAETTKAGRTLHEWVEEAVRAQTRLERTLADVPSIHATHPTSAVSSVADVLSRIAADSPEDSAHNGMLDRLDQAMPLSGAERHRSRADQINQLIAEAKQAESAAV